MALIARNGVWLTRKPFADDPFASVGAPTQNRVAYDGLVQAIASGEMRLASASNMQIYSSTSNVLLGAGGMSNVISVRSNIVEINADVRIRGAVESYLSTEINLQDKVMRLAYPDKGAEASVSDAYLDGSGIVLANEVMGNYEKSIRWRASAGLGAGAFVARGGASNESFWELRGGGLRLSTPKRAAGGTGEVSYGMHINEKEELEMYKRWTDGAGHEYFQRVFTFGGGTLPSDMPVPVSKNPFYNPSTSTVTWGTNSNVSSTNSSNVSSTGSSNVSSTNNSNVSSTGSSNVSSTNNSNVSSTNNSNVSSTGSSNVSSTGSSNVSNNNNGLFVEPWYDYRFR